MIQLCDLITGSIRGLGNPRFDSEIKRDFAGFIHRWITNKKLGGIFKTSLYGGGDLRFSRFKPKIEQNHAGQENLI
jgi:hypothetical protein